MRKVVKYKKISRAQLRYLPGGPEFKSRLALSATMNTDIYLSRKKKSSYSLIEEKKKY